MTVFLLIVCVISIVLSLISVMLSFLVVSKMVDHKLIQTNNIDPNSENFIQGFNDGRDFTWNDILLSYFEMFKDADIYDYEGSVENLTNRMNKLNKDNALRETLTKDLTDYMEYYMKGDSNDNANDY